jgi:DNA-directed RNA polymerase subunit M/transcription elongation factor TFIIS
MRKIQKFIKVYIKSLTSPIEMSFQLDECRAKLGSLGVEVPDTLKECQARLYQHIREMKATIKEEERTRSKRKEHIQKLIADKTAASISGSSKCGKKKAIQILKRIQHAEAVSKVFEKCKRARGKQITGGLSHILVPEQTNNVSTGN